MYLYLCLVVLRLAKCIEIHLFFVYLYDCYEIAEYNIYANSSIN